MYVWLSPQTKATFFKINKQESKQQHINTNETSILQRLRTDVGRLF